MGNNRRRTVVSYDEDGQEEILDRDAFVAGGSKRRSHPPRSTRRNRVGCIAVAQRFGWLDAMRGLSQWKISLGLFLC
jgi:hypothetical protein